MEQTKGKRVTKVIFNWMPTNTTPSFIIAARGLMFIDYSQEEGKVCTDIEEVVELKRRYFLLYIKDKNGKNELIEVHNPNMVYWE